MDTGENSSCSDTSEKLLLENVPGYRKVKSSYAEIVSLDQNEHIDDNDESPFYRRHCEDQPSSYQVQLQSSVSRDDAGSQPPHHNLLLRFQYYSSLCNIDLCRY